MENQNSVGEDRVGLLSDALSEAITVFRRLDDAGRETLLKTLATLFEIRTNSEQRPGPTTVAFAEPTDRFSREHALTPKEFLLKKQPRTDVERVACLGYYLGHYRDQPHFKTLDISKLNTEAAQRKLSNAGYAVDNATKYGYLAPAAKGFKQLSAGGEMFVEALPDRDAASAALSHSRPKRKTMKKQPSKRGS